VQRRTAARPRRRPDPVRVGADDSSLLDLVDNLLTRGVVVSGDVVLGIADVDLVYLRLSALLCAADRVLPRKGRRRNQRRRLRRV
jgi:hypothetical protein